MLDEDGFVGVPPTAAVAVTSHKLCNDEVLEPLLPPVVTRRSLPRAGAEAASSARASSAAQASAPWPKVASLQQFVAGEPLEDYGASLPREASQRLAVFDMYMINSDRHVSNVLVAGAGDEARLIPIDHGLTLPDKPCIESVSFLWSEEAHRDNLDGEVAASVRDWVLSRDVDADATRLRSELGIREHCLLNFRVAGRLLQHCIGAGLSVWQTVQQFCRVRTERPSELERIVDLARLHCERTDGHRKQLVGRPTAARLGRALTVGGASQEAHLALSGQTLSLSAVPAGLARAAMAKGQAGWPDAVADEGEEEVEEEDDEDSEEREEAKAEHSSEQGRAEGLVAGADGTATEATASTLRAHAGGEEPGAAATGRVAGAGDAQAELDRASSNETSGASSLGASDASLSVPTLLQETKGSSEGDADGNSSPSVSPLGTALLSSSSDSNPCSGGDIFAAGSAGLKLVPFSATGVPAAGGASWAPTLPALESTGTEAAAIGAAGDDHKPGLSTAATARLPGSGSLGASTAAVAAAVAAIPPPAPALSAPPGASPPGCAELGGAAARRDSIPGIGSSPFASPPAVPARSSGAGRLGIPDGFMPTHPMLTRQNSSTWVTSTDTVGYRAAQRRFGVTTGVGAALADAAVREAVSAAQDIPGRSIRVQSRTTVRLSQLLDISDDIHGDGLVLALATAISKPATRAAVDRGPALPSPLRRGGGAGASMAEEEPRSHRKAASSGSADLPGSTLLGIGRRPAPDSPWADDDDSAPAQSLCKTNSRASVVSAGAEQDGVAVVVAAAVFWQGAITISALVPCGEGVGLETADEVGDAFRHAAAGALVAAAGARAGQESRLLASAGSNRLQSALRHMLKRNAIPAGIAIGAAKSLAGADLSPGQGIAATGGAATTTRSPGLHATTAQVTTRRQIGRGSDGLRPAEKAKRDPRSSPELRAMAPAGRSRSVSRSPRQRMKGSAADAGASPSFSGRADSGGGSSGMLPPPLKDLGGGAHTSFDTGSKVASITPTKPPKTRMASELFSSPAASAAARRLQTEGAWSPPPRLSGSNPAAPSPLAGPADGRLPAAGGPRDSPTFGTGTGMMQDISLVVVASSAAGSQSPGGARTPTGMGGVSWPHAAAAYPGGGGGDDEDASSVRSLSAASSPRSLRVDRGLSSLARVPSRRVMAVSAIHHHPEGGSSPKATGRSRTSSAAPTSDQGTDAGSAPQSGGGADGDCDASTTGSTEVRNLLDATATSAGVVESRRRHVRSSSGLAFRRSGLAARSYTTGAGRPASPLAIARPAGRVQSSTGLASLLRAGDASPGDRSPSVSTDPAVVTSRPGTSAPPSSHGLSEDAVDGDATSSAGAPSAMNVSVAITVMGPLHPFGRLEDAASPADVDQGQARDEVRILGKRCGLAALVEAGANVQLMDRDQVLATPGELDASGFGAAQSSGSAEPSSRRPPRRAKLSRQSRFGPDGQVTDFGDASQPSEDDEASDSDSGASSSHSSGSQGSGPGSIDHEDESAALSRAVGAAASRAGRDAAGGVAVTASQSRDGTPSSATSAPIESRVPVVPGTAAQRPRIRSTLSASSRRLTDRPQRISRSTTVTPRGLFARSPRLRSEALGQALAPLQLVIREPSQWSRWYGTEDAARLLLRAAQHCIEIHVNVVKIRKS